MSETIEAPKPKLSALAAINGALALRDKYAGSQQHAKLPPFSLNAALRWFSEQRDHEELLEALGARDPRLVIGELLDWHLLPGAKERTATKAIIRQIDQALRAVDEDGNSLYPQAVEMLGFAVVLAPFLPADRLGRVIAEAPKVKTAYAPCLYPARFFEVVSRVMEPFQDQRRETLAISIWHLIHEGRFWEITNGVTILDDAHRAEAAQNEAALADAEQRRIEEILHGTEAGTAERTAAIVSALMQERLPANNAALALMRELPKTVELEDHLAEHADSMRRGVNTSPDRVVLGSAIPWASPRQRPESPIGWVFRQLVMAMEPNPVTGAGPLIKELPKKPRNFRELFPVDVVTGFPFPNALKEFDGKEFPGFPGVRADIIKDSVALERNASYMGNCTKSHYGRQQEQGTYVLFRLEGEDDKGEKETWNASLVWGTYYGDRTRGDHWRIGEVNSRHNRRNVPAALREAAAAMAEAVNAAGIVPRAVEAKVAIEPMHANFSIA